MYQIKIFVSAHLVVILSSLTYALYDEVYRPQLHFSPPSGWMNDPNGLFYHDGVFHLFCQHNPNDTVPGKQKSLCKWS